MVNVKDLIQEIKISDKNYPKPLRDLSDPPKILYSVGDLQSINFKKCLAVVGSRRMTQYGRSVVDRFIPDFVSADVTIVSGFMYGIDTQAHKVTIDNGGRTIAVFACGVDICYPPENEKLYDRIISSGGVLVSEYPLGTKPQLWTFPRRNRIVAALSLLGTFVVEAAENSGSLVTAKLAKKLKRTVYTIPGPITSTSSAGTNYILKNKKAKFIVNSSDIVAFEGKTREKSPIPKLTGLQAKIYQTLSRENCTLDELSAMLGVDITKVSTEVSLMTLKGIVIDIGGMFSVH